MELNEVPTSGVPITRGSDLLIFTYNVFLLERTIWIYDVRYK